MTEESLRIPVSSAAVQGASWASRSGLLTALLIVAPIAILYLALPLQNYTDAKDSLSYAFNIRTGTPVFHPNHLLYEPLNFLVHRAVVALFGPVDPLRTMQLVSTLTAIPALLLICRIAQRWGGDVLPVVAAVGAIAFSFGFWCYAISADGYLPPLFFALATAALLDPARWGKLGGQPPSVALVAIAAFTAAAAVLIHQMYVFFAIALGVLMLLSLEFGPLFLRIRNFLLFGGLSGGIVIAVYVAAFEAVAPEGANFLDWMRGYASQGLSYGAPPSLLSPLIGAVGALTSMLSMNALLSFDSVYDAVMRWFPGKSLFEERFIAETAIGRPLSVLVLAAMALAAVAWLTLAASAARSALARRSKPAPFIDRLLLILILLYSALVLLWEPINREFWIHVYVFATLYCAMNANLRGRLAGLAAAVLCCALFVANFFGAIRPLSNPEADYWRAFHRPAFANAKIASDDAVLISCNYLCMLYLRYFHAGTVIVPNLDDPDAYVTALKGIPPERLLVSKWFLTPHASYIDPVTQAQASPERYAPVIEAFRKAYPGTILPLQGEALLYKFEGGKLVPVSP